MFKLFNLISPSGAGYAVYSVINLIILVVCFLLSAFCATVTRSGLSRAVISSAIIIFIPSVSYFYVLVFEIIPFMEFIKHYDELDSLKRRLYMALFLFIFFTIALLPQNFILHSLAVTVMFVVEIKDVLKKELPVLLKKKRA